MNLFSFLVARGHLMLQCKVMQQLLPVKANHPQAAFSLVLARNRSAL